MAHYLVTGHTGFKGSWLSLLLKSRGHIVSGLGLDPESDSLFERAGIAASLENDLRIDVRDRIAVHRSFKAVQPDYVVHMAAQSLVREGYRNPVATYETNVNGTMHVLEASDQTDSVRCQLVVTTDKVYRDQKHGRPYREDDSLGGADPYSSSKAMADILAQETMLNGRTKLGAIARAGNVIGAGDTSLERLIPDIGRALESGAPLVVRYPQATRPWQHVLDCLRGYLAIIEATEQGSQTGFTWNIGPDEHSRASVKEVVDLVAELVSPRVFSVMYEPSELHETASLALDSTRARTQLRWGNTFGLRESLALAVEAPDLSEGKDIAQILQDHIRIAEAS